MKKYLFKKLLYIILLVLILLLFVGLVYADTITVPTNVHFGFRTGVYINFNEEMTFDNVYREDNYWYFDVYGFKVENANLTITDFFSSESNILKFNVSATSGTSTSEVYCGNRGKPKEVLIDGVTAIEGINWTYSVSNKTLAINATHSSEVNITTIFYLLGDINRDCDVDPADFNIFAGAYGTECGDQEYDPRCDFDDDCDVDPADFNIFAKNYGKSIDC